MRIAIDATPLLLESAGVKTYFYYWIHYLQLLAKKGTIRPFPYLGDIGALNHEVSVLSSWRTWPRLGLLYLVNIPGNPLIDWINSGADLFHATNQVRNPPLKSMLTATIHDMTCWRMPELHTPANVRADRNFAEKVIRRAKGLIAVSENTKKDAVRFLYLDPDKIEVIYPGVAEPYFNITTDEVHRVKIHHGLSRPYILFVGTIEPRKNLDTLLDAYLDIPSSLRAEVELIVAGPAGWSARETHKRLRSGLPGVRYLGYIPEQDLPALMAGATVFAYPSLYEGFGFPVAQALACGVPVIASNISSLPEVTADAAILIDPNSPEDIRTALERLLQSQSLREDLAGRGKIRASQFRWEACAKRSLEFFEKVAGSQ